MSTLYLNVKSGLLFPFQFQILGYVFLFSGIALTAINIWTSIVFILLGGFIVTAYSGIDFRGEQLREYNSFLFFFKFGKWQRIESPEKIFIKKVKRSQKFYGRANQSSTFKKVIYKAFLKLDDNATISLFEDKNQGKVLERSQPIANYFRIEVVDYSN
ncbi:hypothetical protein [Marivirga harenae]|nr:hypothetical protein [Marivirga harenae]WKV13436.1 hypothetical protein Q3Y49_06305 [Marivirga harenae]|tara:strand:+ start:50474 stop:50947 length:474 start_codon:yes stop_codon:yes gene_type:complete